jgi:murein L,D-transpeptidase YcbB/YkuD
MRVLMFLLIVTQAGGPLERLVSADRLPGLRWERITDVRPLAEGLYRSTGWAPLWLEGGRPSAPARALIALIPALADRGLDPTDYDVAWLATTAGNLGRSRPDTLLAARFDATLTVAALRITSALARGRIDPAAAHTSLALARPPVDLAAAVNHLRRSVAPDSILASLEPPWAHYELLKHALAHYRRMAVDSALLRLPRPPRRGVREGGVYTGTAAVRRLLAEFHDLEGPAAAERAGDTVMTAELVDGIRRFQVRQGWQADGVMGDSTWARLTRPLDRQIRQIELTLERWRWLPRQFASPPILVNIPAFRLHFFTSLRDDEAAVVSMNVVVGEAYKHDTPVFADEMTHLIFRPYWEVPASIARREIRPKALRDSSYLRKEQFELLRGRDVVADSPENVAEIGRGVRVRQLPGPANALGGVKFMLPNEFDVYLHDSPARSLFGRSRRDFSHGCIRVADAELLAELVLRDQPGWTPERIRAAMAAELPERVDLRRKIPVLVLYGTALARENGQVYFYQDVYGHDRRLEKLLAGGYPYGQ